MVLMMPVSVYVPVKWEGKKVLVVLVEPIEEG
jgi:hypothetical protein